MRGSGQGAVLGEGDDRPAGGPEWPWGGQGSAPAAVARTTKARIFNEMLFFFYFLTKKKKKKKKKGRVKSVVGMREGRSGWKCVRWYPSVEKRESCEKNDKVSRGETVSPRARRKKTHSTRSARGEGRQSPPGRESEEND